MEFSNLVPGPGTKSTVQEEEVKKSRVKLNSGRKDQWEERVLRFCFYFILSYF